MSCIFTVICKSSILRYGSECVLQIDDSFVTMFLIEILCSDRIIFDKFSNCSTKFEYFNFDEKKILLLFYGSEFQYYQVTVFD